jgi:hypothetical protein
MKKRQNFRRLVQNFTLLALSMGILFVFLELVVFRHLILASDLPRLATRESEVIKFEPNQYGIYRLKDEIAEPFQINESGWNSGHREYLRYSHDNRKRICIVGDSYIEALQVPYTSSVAELLEEELSVLETSPEVYRFGISGAPLSHYVYMIENEIRQYSPDIVIVNLVHNDFVESFQPAEGTYSKSFAKLVFGDNLEHPSLVRPMPYRRDLSWWIKTSAIFRYVWVRQQVRPSVVRKLWANILPLIHTLTEGEKTNQPVYSANVEVSRTRDGRIDAAVDFLFRRLAAYKREQDVDVLVVIDADRGFLVESIKAGTSSDSPVSHLNMLVNQKAIEHGLESIDLTEAFALDYQENQQPFSFRFDGHWNQRAHQIVAREISRKVQDLGILF